MGGKGKLRGAVDGVPFTKDDPRINREGRPRKLPDLEVLLANVLGEEKGDLTAMEGILLALRKKAMSGDVRASELLLNRAYGLLKKEIDLQGNFAVYDEADLKKMTNELYNLTYGTKRD
jgi:hypothetical protein